MPLLDVVTLPARLAVAASRATLGLGQLAAPDGPVRRQGGYADRLMLLIGEDGLIERLLQEDGALDRLLSEGGFVEKLTAEGGTLDQLLELGDTLEAIRPRIAELSEVIPELHASVDTLSRAVEPLGELAGRLPRLRRSSADGSVALAPEQHG